MGMSPRLKIQSARKSENILSSSIPKPMTSRGDLKDTEKNRHLSLRKQSVQSFFSFDQEKSNIFICDNTFLENPGACLKISESASNSNIKISNNYFKVNLFDIICRTKESKRELIIQLNTFEVAPGNPEKTIKISKRFKSLKIRDNEFIRIKEEKKENIWLRLLGCADPKEQMVEFNDDINMESKEQQSGGPKNVGERQEDRVISIKKREAGKSSRFTHEAQKYQMFGVLDHKRKLSEKKYQKRRKQLNIF